MSAYLSVDAVSAAAEHAPQAGLPGAQYSGWPHSEPEQGLRIGSAGS